MAYGRWLMVDGWWFYCSRNLAKWNDFSVYWLQSNRKKDLWVKMNFLELGVNSKVVGNVENYLEVNFQPKICTRSRENAKKPHFLTYFLIWLPSICENRHTVFTKVVDNDPMNISAKFEASILKTFREKSFLTHIDCSQIKKWPQNGWRWIFSSLVSIVKL